LVAFGIELGPLDLQPGTLTTRPQRWLLQSFGRIRAQYLHTDIKQLPTDRLYLAIAFPFKCNSEAFTKM
jgi:hypothetical protein